MQSKAIVLIGPQGSGKGTVADFLKLLGYGHIEVGRILRENSRLKEFTDRGKLCPDNIIRDIIAEEVSKAKSGKIVLDGAPRTREQVNIVLSSLPCYEVLFMILNCEWITCLNRVKTRAEQADAAGLVRQDDIDFDAITNRLDSYFKNIDSIIEEISKKGKDMTFVNANEPIENVRLQVSSALSSVFVSV